MKQISNYRDSRALFNISLRNC